MTTPDDPNQLRRVVPFNEPPDKTQVLPLELTEFESLVAGIRERLRQEQISPEELKHELFDGFKERRRAFTEWFSQGWTLPMDVATELVEDRVQSEKKTWLPSWVISWSTPTQFLCWLAGCLHRQLPSKDWRRCCEDLSLNCQSIQEFNLLANKIRVLETQHKIAFRRGHLMELLTPGLSDSSSSFAQISQNRIKDISIDLVDAAFSESVTFRAGRLYRRWDGPDIQWDGKSGQTFGTYLKRVLINELKHVLKKQQRDTRLQNRLKEPEALRRHSQLLDDTEPVQTIGPRPSTDPKPAFLPVTPPSKSNPDFIGLRLMAVRRYLWFRYMSPNNPERWVKKPPKKYTPDLTAAHYMAAESLLDSKSLSEMVIAYQPSFKALAQNHWWKNRGRKDEQWWEDAARRCWDRFQLEIKTREGRKLFLEIEDYLRSGK